MIDLIVSGIIDKDFVVFTMNGESQRIDHFSKQVHFTVEATRTNRLYFEQISERDTPILLNIFFLPIRGVFNVLTYNTDPWEEDISAFKLSGYIDITLEENTEITFELRQGKYEKSTNTFIRPKISFSQNVIVKQTCLMDVGEITKKHRGYVLNICSAAILLLGILLLLFFAGLHKGIYDACIIISIFVISFIILTLCMIVHSFKQKSFLISTLSAQETKIL